MKKIITVLFIVAAIKTTAQFPNVNIPGSQVRKITSSIVMGQEYELQILLPAGYSNSTKKYPVVYLMDSQWDFPLVKSIYGQQYYDGFIPELIIVGITWGGINPNPDSLRVRDYTPVSESRLPQSGGADKYLDFMKNELFPFMENNYRVNNDRTIMGNSLGGLITLYALFTHTDMFTGYIASSPAYGWGQEAVYKYEKEFYEKKLPNNARLYMTVGDVERNRPGFERLAKFLEARNYSNLHVRSKVLENTSHSGSKSETYGRGLQYVFDRPSVSLSENAINKYVGGYQSPNGNTIEIKYENDQLVINFGNNNKYVLLAASQTDLYGVNDFLNIHFKITNDRVDGFQLERYGSSQFIKKQF